MNLKTDYLGLELDHPFMAGASPMCDNLDTVKALEDAGTSAIVMHSLFEEEIISEEMATHAATDFAADSFAEALSYFPEPDNIPYGSEEYMNQLRRIKEAVGVPVIGSLNSCTEARWIEYARQMQEAGADAIELNAYLLATDSSVSGADLEARTVEMVRQVKGSITIPVAVKLSPYYSSLANFACQLDSAGANGLVLFNRFYEPDLDVQDLEVKPDLKLSEEVELLTRLRWLAILSPKVDASLAVTGGVHNTLGAIKAIMAGAHAVQMVSALFRNGPQHLGTVRGEVAQWLNERGYDSLKQLRGSMNLENAPNADAYTKANYLQILNVWKDKC